MRLETVWYLVKVVFANTTDETGRLKKNEAPLHAQQMQNQNQINNDCDYHFKFLVLKAFTFFFSKLTKTCSSWPI